MDYSNFLDRPNNQRIKEIADEFHLSVDPTSIHLFLDFQMTYREIEESYNQLLNNFDLSESRFVILMFLFYAPNGQLPTSTLANKLGVMRPTISKLVKGMKAKKLVTNVASNNDKRRIDVKITLTGQKLLKQFLPSNYQAIDNLFENFSDTEKEQFSKLLKKLLNNKNRLKQVEEDTHGNK